MILWRGRCPVLEGVSGITALINTLEMLLNSPLYSGSEETIASSERESAQRLKQVVEEEINSLSEMPNSILNLIDQMPNDLEKEVLLFRYFKGEDWIEISDITGFSVSHLYKISNKAITSFEEIYSMKAGETA